jgi:hypothetical protein
MLQLRFLKDAGDPPHQARSWVFSVRYDDPENHMLLTPECISPTELETWIDDLKNQLDAIKAEAHRRYAAL